LAPEGFLMGDKEQAAFSEEESKKRFEAALKGARIAGHKPMESLTRNKPKAQPKKRKSSKK
jgi:hypothetical protein